MNKMIFFAACTLVIWACTQQQPAEQHPLNQTASNVAGTWTSQPLTIFTTARDTNLRLAEGGAIAFGDAAQPLETEISLFVNPDVSFQSFLGIGGAITDASAEVFATLPEDKQQELLRAYFDSKDGIGYSLLRTNIHSCDFSSGSYTYVSAEDPELSTFDIEHDRAFKLPMIKRAIAAAGGHITFYASPWSPPAFMKDNKDMLHGGKLLPEYYPAWARYYVKFIQAYEAAGVSVWGISIQNEPMATQRWESCIYTAEEERDFLKLHLGPTLAASGLGSKNIIVWDHNRDLITHRANTIFSDPEAAKYAWGVGFHWYETWTGGDPMFENVAAVHASFPGKNLLFTEGCVESFNPERYQYWPNAERYGNAMINDFNAGSVGWTDWNILLDQQGGPNHVGNFCFAPLHADTKTHELIYTPSYYYIGHFSKFVRPGAKRISAVSSRSPLLTTAFVNADGSLVCIVMNQSDENITYKLYIGNEAMTVAIPAHAMQTLTNKS